jgi:predicted small lipoprotein YifL
MHQLIRRHLTVVVCVVVMSGLAACGQKGPLIKPAPQPAGQHDADPKAASPAVNAPKPSTPH